MRAKTITCPAGEVESFEPGQIVEFDPEACGPCQLRNKCTYSASGGRTIRIAEDERRRWATPASIEEARVHQERSRAPAEAHRHRAPPRTHRCTGRDRRRVTAGRGTTSTCAVRRSSRTSRPYSGRLR